jgi:hypothetical protein
MLNQICRRCAELVGHRDRYCENCGAWVVDVLRDRVEVEIGAAAGVSDRGRRHHRNEDALALRDVGGRTAVGAQGGHQCLGSDFGSGLGRRDAGGHPRGE